MGRGLTGGLGDDGALLAKEKARRSLLAELSVSPAPTAYSTCR